MYLSLKCGYVSLSQLFYLIHFSTKLIRGTTVYMQTFASVLFSLLVPSLSICEFKTERILKTILQAEKGEKQPSIQYLFWWFTPYTISLVKYYDVVTKKRVILHRETINPDMSRYPHEFSLGRTFWKRLSSTHMVLNAFWHQSQTGRNHYTTPSNENHSPWLVPRPLNLR